MSSAVKLSRNLFLIVSFCLVFTVSFSMPLTEQAYAISSKADVYDPYEEPEYYIDEDDTELLRGSEVPVSKTYQALIQYNISTGGTKYKGSGECWGYANKVKSLFGGGGSTRYVRKKTTKKNVYNALKNVRPGTHVRFGNSKTGSGRHSIAVYKVTKDRIYFSDGNWGSYNSINHYNMSLKAFCDYHGYDYIMWYIQPTGSYKTSSAKAVVSVYDSENKIDVACRPVSGAKSYTFYRASSKNGTYKKIKTSKSPLFTDKNPLIGTNYYKVKPNNKSMSSSKKAFNKLVIPTVRSIVTKKGYTKLSWNKIKGAKKYGIYKVDYDESSGKPKYNLLKTVTGTSYTHKKEETELAIRAIASNKKASSGYNIVDALRYAPQPVILNGGMDESTGEFIIDVSIPYDLCDYTNVFVELRRSKSKNGKYETVSSVLAYTADVVDYYDYQFDNKTFDPNTSIIKLSDTSWDSNTQYYYKAVARSEWREGLDSKIKSYTTPQRPKVDVAYGSGTLTRYLGGDPIKYEYDGVTYTKNLHLDSSDYLYYEDSSGQGYAVDTYGYVWFASYDKEYGEIDYGDYVGNNTYDDDPYDDTDW